MGKFRWTSVIPLALLLAGCGGHEPATTGVESLPDAEVQVGEVRSAEHLRLQGLPGTVHPSDQAVIAAKLMATVASADVVIGQKVSKGDLLLILDAGEVQAQVEQAEAGLAQLNRNLEREQALLAQSATTAEAVRTLEDQIRVARARLSEARTMESYTRIKAPFDGTITRKEVRRGDLAVPGVPLLNIEGIGNLEVHVQVPDSLMAVPYGDVVEIMANDEVIKAQLAEWSPAADPASRTRLAKLTVPAGSSLRSGQYVTVRWPAGRTESLWVPVTALSRIGQLERVFTVEDGKVQLQLIKTGLQEDDRIQVLAGLRSGDQVVLNPSKFLLDGQPATLRQ